MSTLNFIYLENKIVLSKRHTKAIRVEDKTLIVTLDSDKEIFVLYSTEEEAKNALKLANQVFD